MELSVRLLEDDAHDSRTVAIATRKSEKDVIALTCQGRHIVLINTIQRNPRQRQFQLLEKSTSKIQEKCQNRGREEHRRDWDEHSCILALIADVAGKPTEPREPAEVDDEADERQRKPGADNQKAQRSGLHRFNPAATVSLSTTRKTRPRPRDGSRWRSARVR